MVSLYFLSKTNLALIGSETVFDRYS